MPIQQGMNQQTAAVTNLIRTAFGQRAARPRRKSAKKKRAAPRARKAGKRSSKKKAARLVKGSAAAKRYMAKIRRKKK